MNEKKCFKKKKTMKIIDKYSKIAVKMQYFKLTKAIKIELE